MRYLVFAYDQYYPTGGMHDLVDAKNTLEEAMKVADWYVNKVKELRRECGV